MESPGEMSIFFLFLRNSVFHGSLCLSQGCETPARHIYYLTSQCLIEYPSTYVTAYMFRLARERKAYPGSSIGVSWQ
jgi:hypothetical protein